MEENLECLDEVLLRLEQSGLKLKPSKCQILQDKVVFLGHVVSEQGVLPNPKLVESVTDWLVPRCRREVQQFLGLANYYRRFVPGFSDVAVPLTRLTSKEVDFAWESDAQTAFDQLKQALCSAPVLSFPQEGGDFILDTDASAFGVCGVLQQLQHGEEKVIAYGSKKLNRQQRRYCTTRRELLAIVVFLREFRNYLLGSPFLIRTDHSSLIWLLHFKEPQGQLARWMEYIYQFKFTIAHRDGRKHINADSLSRSQEDEGACSEFRLGVLPKDLPCGGCSYCAKRHNEWADFVDQVDDVIPLSQSCRQVVTRNQAARRNALAKNSGENNLEASSAASKMNPTEPEQLQCWTRATTNWVDGYTPEMLRKAQEGDSALRPLLGWLEAGAKPEREEAASLSPETRNFELMELVDNVVYLNWVDPSGVPSLSKKLVVPSGLRGQVLQSCHNNLFSAHLGVRKTVDKIRQRFHWPGLRRDVKQHIRSCAICTANKMPFRKFKAQLADFRVGAPMDRVALDLLGPVPMLNNGNCHILVLVDYFTRWVEAFPIPDQCAETVAHKMVCDFICRFGTLLEIHSDQGAQLAPVVPEGVPTAWSHQDEIVPLPPKRQWVGWAFQSHPGVDD